MPLIPLEQAIFFRSPNAAPRMQARSPGFEQGWLSQVEQILTGFGERPVGVPCAAAVFAQPLGDAHVAIVHAADPQAREGTVHPQTDGQPEAGSPSPTMGSLDVQFRVLVLPRAAYRRYLGDPFEVADRFPPPWGRTGAELESLTMPAQPLPSRTVEQVQWVLKRVKAHAFKEDENPANAELTAENAESPALLGGVQILVDGGKLVFFRTAPDPALLRGLWTLLPNGIRAELWPATFAYGNSLGFDALVVPRRGQDDYSTYATEEQACDYPAGQYELALQTAAESGDQAALDQLFARRSASETLRLALMLVVVLALAVLVLRIVLPPPLPQQVTRMSPDKRERVAIAAAMVANGDPFAAVALQESARYRGAERAATATAIVATCDPLAAIVQLRTAHARYVEIWKPAQ